VSHPSQTGLNPFYAVSCLIANMIHVWIMLLLLLLLLILLLLWTAAKLYTNSFF
jgi:hypothetical protein